MKSNGSSEFPCVLVHSKILRFESHALGVVDIDLMRSVVKNRHDEVGLLVVLSISLLLFLALHQELNVFVSKLLVLGDPGRRLLLQLCTLLSPLLEMLLALSRQLQVFLHALAYLFLSLSVLS